MNVLVVGANGQLGSACSRALVAAGHSVRGSVRHPSRAADLDGVELVTADLGQDPDLDALLSGIEVVVVTANVAAPRAGDDPGRFTEGEHRLVDAARRLGVARVVLPSVPVTHVDEHIPLAAERRRLEEHVRSAVADIFSRMLGRRVRVVSTPTVVFAAVATLLRRIAPVASQTMALNRYLGASETTWSPGGGGLVAPSTMTTVEEFLRRKAALPGALPPVA